jgi:hypothetical protein
VLRALARRVRRHLYQGARCIVKQVDARTVNLLNRVAALEREVPTQLETTAELAIVHGRVLARLEQQLAILTERTADQAAASLVGRPLAELGEGCARLLEWATGPGGPAGQAGAWLEPFISLAYRPGEVCVSGVSPRAVELPYVLTALSTLSTGSSIVVCGAANSPLPLLLAGLGYSVTVVSNRAYAVIHPRIQTVPNGWSGPDVPCSAVVGLASLDPAAVCAAHEVGLLLEHAQRWLEPGGILVLSSWGTTHSTGLSESWRIVDIRYAYRAEGAWWETTSIAPSVTAPLVLMQARLRTPIDAAQRTLDTVADIAHEANAVDTTRRSVESR